MQRLFQWFLGPTSLKLGNPQEDGFQKDSWGCCSTGLRTLMMQQEWHFESSLHRNGEEWRADRLLLNKEVMMTAAVKRFIPLLDEVARDFCHMLRARVDREGRGEEEKRSLTIDPSPDLFRFALEGRRSSLIWCHWSQWFEPVVFCVLLRRSEKQCVTGFLIDSDTKVWFLFYPRRQVKCREVLKNGFKMGTSRLLNAASPLHPATIDLGEWRGGIIVTSLIWQAFIQPNNQLIGLSHKILT